MSTLTPEIIAQLAAPFALDQVEVKPGAVRQDGSAALALAYADWRVYTERLDRVIGPTGWSIQLIPWGPTRVIARLTLLGVTKDASGEGDPDDQNCGTIAEAQAKKRACAEFGLGRYLYTLPRIWGKGQGDRRSFTFDDPQGIVFQLHQQAGLLPARATPSALQRPVEQPPAPSDQRNGNGAASSNSSRLATARAALADAEQRTTMLAADGPPATDRQRSAIIALVARCAEFGIHPNQVDRAGELQDIPRLSSLRRASNLPSSLTKPRASTLIGELDTLVKQAEP